MRLPKTSYNWAIRHLMTDGDTDLFPRTVELLALRYQANHGVIDNLAQIDLTNYIWKGGRRLLVPKGVLAFRHGTQLDAVDSVVIAALIRKLGKKLEALRVPVADQVVFSYRFQPTDDGRLYGRDSGWLAFWDASRRKAQELRCSHVLMADIADFYNHIYHHVVENQLDAAGLSNPQQRVIKNFLQTYSETVSRGVPVGPHSVHLLAEMSLNPIDDELAAAGYRFCRYVDDFHIFCDSEETASGALYELANCLDSQQRLTLSNHKTKVLTSAEFIDHAETMMVNRPINDDEADVLEVIRDYTDDDPYSQVQLSDLDDGDLERLDAHTLSALLEAYVDAEPRNFSRMGWLMRRLRQVGAPGAIDYVVDHLEEFAPVFGDVARYIMAAAANYRGDLPDLGERLAAKLDLPAVRKSPYLQLVMVDLLATVPDLNHAEIVTAAYEDAPMPVRREILRVAGANSMGGWLRGRKQDFRTMDPWSRTAYLSTLTALPGDEAQHWLRSIRRQLTPMERLVVQYAFQDRRMNVGDTHLR